DLAAADAEIAQRAVVETAQLGFGDPLAPPRLTGTPWARREAAQSRPQRPKCVAHRFTARRLGAADYELSHRILLARCQGAVVKDKHVDVVVRHGRLQRLKAGWRRVYDRV